MDWLLNGSIHRVDNPKHYLLLN